MLKANPFRSGQVQVYREWCEVDTWHAYGATAVVDAPVFEFTLLDHEPFERNEPLPTLDLLNTDKF